ncbi:MAG: hypothetical protein ACREUC_12670, partial [Steroidobacteraceae bacterium]
LAPGSIGGVRGEVDSEGERIVVDRLSVMQPVVVALLAEDADRPLQLEIVKDIWDQAVRTARTDEQGRVRTQFRTQESFGIRVRATSDRRARYSLLVWAGEEPSAPPLSIFATARGSAADAPRSSTASSDSPSTPFSLIVVGVAVAVLVAASIWWLARRRRSARGE